MDDNYMAFLYYTTQGGLAIGFVICLRLSGLRCGFRVTKSFLLKQGLSVVTGEQYGRLVSTAAAKYSNGEACCLLTTDHR